MLPDNTLQGFAIGNIGEFKRARTLVQRLDVTGDYALCSITPAQRRHQFGADLARRSGDQNLSFCVCHCECLLV